MTRLVLASLGWVLLLGPTAACKEKPSTDTKAEEAPIAPQTEHPQIESAGRAVKQLVRGQYEPLRAEFDQAMQQAMPDDAAVEKWWRGAVQGAGRFRKPFAASRKTKGDLATVVVTCLFENAPLDVAVLFNAANQIAGFNVVVSANPEVRPQTPKPPFPYSSREVSYDNPAGGTKLAGTLTVPPGDGPHPAVLLISGSGSQDRNGAMAGHKPFWLIADRLSRKGVAVLRVDDRGVGGSTGDPTKETIELIASDVEASLAFLGSQPGIDPKRIGLIGHSVGGIVAPMVASRSPDVAFVVSLAGSAISGVELLPMQVGAMLTAQGKPADAINDVVAAHEILTPLIAADAAKSEIEPAIERLVKAVERLLPAGADPQAAREQVEKQLATPWHRSFARADPERDLRKLTVPVLFMLAEKDTAVPATPNAARAKEALSSNPKARIETLAGLNHLFQNAETGAMSEYAVIAETFDERALEMLTGWVLESAGL